MDKILEIIAVTNNSPSEINSPVQIVESAGPSGYENYAYLKKENNETKVTFPHIDRFNNSANNYQEIILSGSTDTYGITIYENNEEYSLKQYFLENPIRESKIQYLIKADNNGFTAFIPGLVFNSLNVFCYVHSYIAEDGEVTIELPFNQDEHVYSDYSIENCSFTRNGNIITLTNIAESKEVTIKLSEDNFAKFWVFADDPDGEGDDFAIKDACMYGDYIIASQLANNLPGVNNILQNSRLNSNIENRFTSLELYTPAEIAPNNTPRIYKVPAAFVNNKFMTNVVGISTNYVIMSN